MKAKTDVDDYRSRVNIHGAGPPLGRVPLRSSFRLGENGGGGDLEETPVLDSDG